jgi:hypothetical protein
MRTDGRTDMTRLIVVFRDFAKAPNNCVKTTIAIQKSVSIFLPPYVFRLKKKHHPLQQNL